jgi:hypothetical protein
VLVVLGGIVVAVGGAVLVVDVVGRASVVRVVCDGGGAGAASAVGAGAGVTVARVAEPATDRLDGATACDAGRIPGRVTATGDVRTGAAGAAGVGGAGVGDEVAGRSALVTGIAGDGRVPRTATCPPPPAVQTPVSTAPASNATTPTTASMPNRRSSGRCRRSHRKSRRRQRMSVTSDGATSGCPSLAGVVSLGLVVPDQEAGANTLRGVITTR